MSTAPALSVVVVVVSDTTEGSATTSHLERCLEALATQTDPPTMEVIVPHHARTAGLEETRRRFPAVRFLRADDLRTYSGRGGSREHHDELRARGLAAARGEIVAMLEDHALPARDWCARVVEAHRAGYAAVGGAIENGVDRPLNWAVFFCDFGRYQPPLRAGPARHVSDINVSYKRRALDATREVWRERYHEPAVHGKLLARGETLFLSAEMVVEERREHLALGPLLAERFHWGRLFAAERGRELGLPRRLAYGVVAPALPILLFARLLRLQLERRAAPGRFLLVAPLTFALLVAWSAGELAGYLTGSP